jgi:hypothetical protein
MKLFSEVFNYRKYVPVLPKKFVLRQVLFMQLGCPETYCVVQAGLEIVNLLSLPFGSENFRLQASTNKSGF